MILFIAFLIQAGIYDSTVQERSFCASAQSSQPERFCLADRKHERAERGMASALAKARLDAVAKKREIQRFARAVGGVTLGGDPVKALATSQQAWQRSYRADCNAAGLDVATGNGGTEGVTLQWECEADRILDRARFLTKLYSTER